jgi:Flp pilus assembly pilin Flp
MRLILSFDMRRFLRDDSAQDLVEYAYLSMFIGLVGILVWSAIVGRIGDRYTDYNTGVQNLWEPPPAP